MPERDWERLGVVPEGHRVTAVVASPEGFGLLGATREPALEHEHVGELHLLRR